MQPEHETAPRAPFADGGGRPGSYGGRVTVRRRLLRGAAALLGAGATGGALLQAGCTPGGGATAGTATKQAGPVTLRFVPANWHLEEDKQVISQFQAENPRIKVEIEPLTGNYMEKVTALQAANSLPDNLYTADVYVKPTAVNKVATDLEKLAAKDKQFDIKDVYPVMLDLGRIKEVPGLYMLPWALDVLVLYYNKSMFTASGVPFPKPTWTVDDLIDAAKRLTKDTGDPATSQYGINLNWTWWAEYVPWMRGYGGDMLSEDGRRCTIDSPASVEGIEAMTGLVTRHRVAPPPGTNFGGDAFNLGKVAMMATIRNGAAAIRRAQVDFDWDAEIRPAMPRKRVTGMGTAGNAVSTQTKAPDDAWILAKYMISPTAQRIYAGTYASVPVLRSMRNDPSWRNLAPPPANTEAFVAAADIGTLPPEFPLACGSVYTGDVQQIMNTAFNAILTGSSGVAPAMGDAARQINACLASNAK
ncbi:MAG TPA: sugar ABC transporter substrate-binding protein [Chloroflexota bacterium]|nr:sugar ABC transporter substrate-binding protein [Chloroflexota bacterium]